MPEGEIKFADRPNPWARISEIAAKVGVKPITEERKAATITALGADGYWYDVWEVVVAVLDRLERAG